MLQILLFVGDVLLLEHQKFTLKPVKLVFYYGSDENRRCSIFGTPDFAAPNLTSDTKSDIIRIPPPTFTLKPVKTGFYYMEMPKTGDVLFLEHQKSVIHQIW